MSILLAAWEAQLALVTELRVTGGAASLAGTRSDTRDVPAAFVYLSNEESAPNTTGTLYVSQMVTQTVAVVIAVQNQRDPSGEAAMSDLETIRAAIFAQLHGQMLAGAHSPIVHAQGNAQGWNDSTLWFEDQFRTTFLRRT